MDDGQRLEREADVFAEYLLGRPPDERVRALYRAAMEKISIATDEKDAKLLEFVLRNPRFVGLADAGTALVRRQSAFRKRLLVMFAIVECLPSQSDLFLPPTRIRFYPACVFWSGCRAAVKALLGSMLVGWI